MNKNLIKTLILLLVCGILLSACSQKPHAVPGGDPSVGVKVTNGTNGGFIIEKGDYYFFINGSVSSYDDNTFGTPVKGSLMRVKKADNNEVKDPVIIVPQLMIAGDKSSGVFIFGDYVYYATPSTEKDKNGQVQSSYLDFCRMKLSGGKPEKLFTKENNSIQYRYFEMPDGSVYLVYVQDNNIYSLKAGGKTAKLLVEETTSVIFSENLTHEFIYYTMAEKRPDETGSGSDEITERFNLIYRVNAVGEGNSSYILRGNKVDKDNNKVPGRNDEYSYSLDKHVDNAAEVNVLYYTKNSGGSSSISSYGYFAVSMLKESVTDDDEVFIAMSKPSNALMLGIENGKSKGYYTAQADGVYYFKDKGTKDVNGNYEFDKALINDDKSVTLLYNTEGYIYYSKSSGELYKIKDLPSRVTEEEKNATSSLNDTEKVNNDVLDFNSWYKPEIINGNIFYLSTGANKYSYVYYFDLINSNADKDGDDKNVWESKLLGDFEISFSAADRDEEKARIEDEEFENLTGGEYAQKKLDEFIKAFEEYKANKNRYSNYYWNELEKYYEGQKKCIEAVIKKAGESTANTANIKSMADTEYNTGIRDLEKIPKIDYSWIAPVVIASVVVIAVIAVFVVFRKKIFKPKTNA